MWLDALVVYMVNIGASSDMGCVVDIQRIDITNLAYVMKW